MALPPYNVHFEPIVGSVCAKVTDNADPDGNYRVQVQYATPSGEILSAWARVTTLMSGPGRGWACLPEVDDEVLLKFVHGHPDHPIVIGSLFNGKDTVPYDNADGNNDERIFWSRSEHKFTLFDGDGSEHITVESSGGETKMELLTSDKAINWTSSGDVTFKCADGKFDVDASGNVEMKAGANHKAEAGGNIELKAGSNFDINGSAGVAIKGPQVKVVN